jgi:hypothetical protein
MSVSDIIIKAEVFDPDHINPSTTALNAYLAGNAGQGVKWHDPAVILFPKTISLTGPLD